MAKSASNKTSRKDILAVLWGLCQPIADNLGYSLYDVEYVKEGKERYVRIFIDKQGGVTIDDCERASKSIGAALDEKDPINQAYILEVSSPGLDRALKREEHFAENKGKTVDIKLYKAVNGQKVFQGVLLGLENGIVSIEAAGGQMLKFEKDDIAMCRLAVFF